MDLTPIKILATRATTWTSQPVAKSPALARFVPSGNPPSFVASMHRRHYSRAPGSGPAAVPPALSGRPSGVWSVSPKRIAEPAHAADKRAAVEPDPEVW